MFLFTQYTSMWLSTASTHYLAALPSKMSAFNSHMWLSAYNCNMKWTLKICCHVIVT